MTFPQPHNHAFRGAGEPPIWAPYYGAPFPTAVKRFWKKYTLFSGRASRSEYWWWTLASAGVVIVLPIFAIPTGLQSQAGMIVLGLLLIWGLTTIVPSLALTVRRLHDANLSGWLLLVGLVPFLGGIALLVMTILESNQAGQRFDQPVNDSRVSVR